MKLKGIHNVVITCLMFITISFTSSVYSNNEKFEIEQTQNNQNQVLTHTVTKGETAYSISKDYNIPIETLYAFNPKASSGIRVGERLVIAQPQGGANSAPSTYTVKSKETLYSISKQLDISIDKLVSLNPELKSKPLYVGQVLQLRPSSNTAKPTFVEHKVSSKETLYGIAKQYNTTSDALLAFNPELKNGLKEGSVIVVPIENATLQAANSTLLDINAINIGLVLPFENKSQSQGARFVEYYEGLLIALEELKQRGFSANVYVFDLGSETGTTKLKSLLDTYEMKNLDLIIGGVSTEQVQIMADFAKKNAIKYAIPFPTSSKVVNTNSYVFQVNEDVNSLSSSVAKAFVSKFSNANVVFVTSSDSKVDFVRDLTSQLSNNGTISKSVALDAKLADNLKQALDSKKNNIIVATSGSIGMLQSLFTAVNTIKQAVPAANITLFGQPEWQTYVQYIPEYSKYNTFIYTPFFINEEDPNTKDFIASYKKWYNNKTLINTFPRYGALGYDTGIYFFTALMKYGKNFETSSSINTVSTLQTPFAFRKVSNTGGYINTGFYFINYADGGYIQKIAYAQW